MRAFLLVAAAALLVPAESRAADAVTRVDAYLDSLASLSAQFVQVVQDRKGEITDRATGTLSIARPNRFRWDYREPYTQTIVADGRKLWLYDPDLEQVTVRSLEQGLGATPAMLLSGSGDVADAFAAGPVEQQQGLTWCRLLPKQPGSDFERVSLAFGPRNELAAMELVDKLGQTTTIQFSAVKRATQLDESLFRFVPPAGADVIGDVAVR
ncbi:MAG TPA: outer membrane lipoprotein chaperone LolA [Steroidobacteraceae bacterium]|nr:outer membrane lipoprotein chaperone LolA [Steroidobacteraceae bacterium]